MKTRIFASPALALMILQILPTVAVAAGCSVSALDTVAGLGSQVTITGCIGVSETTLRVSGSNGGEYTQQLSLDAEGSAVALIPSKNTQTAGTYTVSAASKSTSFTVIADRADDEHSTLTVSPSTIRAGSDIATVTAILRDRFGNPVSGRPMALLSNRIADEISVRSAQTDDNGRFLWSVTSSQGGLMTLIPYDILSGRQLKLRADVTVTTTTSFLRGALTGFEQGGEGDGTAIAAELGTIGDVDEFELTLPQNATSVKANELFSMNVRALKNGEVVRSYIGSLLVESSDPDAELPKKGEDPNSPSTGRIDMRSVDQGQRNVPLSFLLRRKGPQTITVSDKVNPSIRGTITINVLREDGAGPETITILSPKDRSRIKGHSVMLQGKAPSLVNLRVKGGEQEVIGETDEEGVFRINVQLNEEDNEATLFVTSENGTYESEALHVIVDNEAPKIETISIDPAEGKTGDKALLSIRSEAGLGSAVASFEGKDIPLTETGGGLYTVELTAPNDPKVYDISVTATDTVGNASTLLTKWTVKAKDVPVVQGVEAESQPRQVSIKWKAVEGMSIREYIVYIADAEDPTNYLYSVPTKQAVTSAVIKDLPLGKTYQFSLTAINTDGDESPEKSDPATATPLGLQLTVKPGNDSLMLEWNKIPDLPLARYDLEYGVEEGVYAERREIDGAAVTTVLRDLINGVTYYLKLTPVTVTGKTMPELATTASGTPGGTGFIPGTSDPVPTDILDTLHPGASLPPSLPPVVTTIPETPGSGISSMMAAMLVLTSVVGGLFWRHYRKQQKLAQEFLKLMQQKYQS